MPTEPTPVKKTEAQLRVEAMHADLDTRAKVVLRAQHGTRHFPWNDVARSVSQYRADFGLGPDVSLVGMVYTNLERNAPTDAGVSIQTALASEAELKARSAGSHE